MSGQTEHVIVPFPWNECSDTQTDDEEAICYHLSMPTVTWQRPFPKLGNEW